MGFEPPEDLEGWADMEMFVSNLPYLPANLGEKAEFITTFVLQLLQRTYRFYRGTNPLAQLAFAAVQCVFRTTSLVRWRLAYFDHPIEMRLVKRLLRRQV